MLLDLDPKHAAALNNAGVQYELLGMRILSVSSYKQAVQLGETLAMSNLASRYMSGGFEEEAQDLLDRGRSADNPHPNVGRAMGSLADLRDSDKAARKAAMAAGGSLHKVFRDFGEEYYSSTEPVSLAGDWAADAGHILSLEQSSSGGDIAGNWRGTKVSLRGTNQGRSVHLVSSEGEQAYGVLSADETILEVASIKEGRMELLTLRRAT
jgi:hypothetical protein